MIGQSIYQLTDYDYQTGVLPRRVALTDSRSVTAIQDVAYTPAAANPSWRVPLAKQWIVTHIGVGACCGNTETWQSFFLQINAGGGFVSLLSLPGNVALPVAIGSRFNYLLPLGSGIGLAAGESLEYSWTKSAGATISRVDLSLFGWEIPRGNVQP